VDGVSEREPGTPDEDELWRSIVDNFGDRAELAASELEPAANPSAPVVVPDPVEQAFEESEVDAFVPPDPPLEPLPRGPRLAAWLGVLVAPLLLLSATLAHYWLPSIVGLALIAWFVGGFGYLVATMPGEPRDPDDDGAVV
jgi:hypothetical protein